MATKRKLPPTAEINGGDLRSREVIADAGLAGIASNFRNLFERVAGSKPDPTNPVVNGASSPPKPILRNIIAELASQGERWGEDIGLLTSLADTKFLDGGMVDDKSYQMEKILQLAASLPVGSKALDDLSHTFIKVLWESLEHPPLSMQGEHYKFRTADGSYNNIMYPHLGRAGSSYARTVIPQTLQPGVLPDPGVIFDSIFARGEEVEEHPNKISSMLFYLASIIIHDVFHTDEKDYSKVKTSSYLDLAPLYGSSEEQQAKIRTFKDGLLKPDAFSESRLLGFPPGVSALVICFNRFHNYVALQLKEINEGGRFTPPTRKDDEKGWKKFDNDIFQTARLVTCGLYVNIILTDYVRTILNLNRTNSTWTLDPRNNFGDVFDSTGVPSGIGNQVSVEFNLVYRWHSAISKRDEKWSEALYASLFPGRDISTITEEELVMKLRQWAMKQNPDPSKWELDNGKYKRTERGAFRDEDLVEILAASTEDVACAFGPRQVPVCMKLIETMGMKQARAWNVATLNEFRKFFKLEPHKTFSDITKNEEVAHALESLYGHPDYVEMYPGMVAEDAKIPLEPGSGLCPGYTISRTILADAVALTRGDRFYTIDYSPANLTNWGWNQVKSDPDVAQGTCIYNLIMRALPNYYRGNSVYAMYPFTVPEESRRILTKLGKAQDYNFDPPSFVPVPTVVKTWKGTVSVLTNQQDFRVPWGEHTFYLTGHDYMLSGDNPENAAQKSKIMKDMYCPVNGLDEVRKFYEALTTQLVEIKSKRLRGQWYQLDACRDVGNPSHAVFVAQMFHIPLKAPGDMMKLLAVEVDQLYLAFAVLFAYVFLDLDTARSFKLREGAKSATEQISKLIKIVCEAVKVGNFLHLDNLFSSSSSGQLLGDYGVRLLQRLFEGGKSVDDVVWEIIPTAAAAVATQAQHFAQMLDLYLTDKYSKYWPEIQKCAWSETPEDFEKLKSYALEANRLAPAAFGLLRRANSDTVIHDGPNKDIPVHRNEQIYTDFIAVGLDPDVFPDPEEIKLDRDRSLYIHHGYGPHACVGRGMVEVAMAAQLKVFAKLKNLRRAPGLQGEMKKSIPVPNPVSSDPKPNPGSVTVYMKEDWSDWWPFPTTLKVHHDGFFESQEQYLGQDTGLPNLEEEVADSRIENQDANGLAPDDE